MEILLVQGFRKGLALGWGVGNITHVGNVFRILNLNWLITHLGNVLRILDLNWLVLTCRGQDWLVRACRGMWVHIVVPWLGISGGFYWWGCWEWVVGIYC